MKYTELKIKVNKRDLEKVEAVLIENGHDSMMIDDPDDVRDILDNPAEYRYDYINEALTEDLSRMPEITLYFEDDEEGRAQAAETEGLLRDMAARGEVTGLSFGSRDTGDDSEWLYKWQEHFKPSRIGDRIVVKPSWEDYEPAERDLVIEMDPGMAFGSGLHETTTMCIQALEKVLPEMPGARVLDVGCGTGILAIAAALLGAEDCLGTDIDPDAVRVAGENIEHNGLSGRIRAVQGDLTEGIDYKADIITANLMADLVMRLSPAAARHLDVDGVYITSGILDVKEAEVCKAITEAGFSIREVLHDGEWCAVVAVKNA